MKTNAERAQEVLTRASTNESTPKPKKKLSKKWIAAISSTLAAVIVVTSLGLGLWLGGVFDFGFVSLDKKYLANFSSYSALGAGSQSAADPNTVLADTSGSSSAASYLLSISKNGSVARARYANTPDGKGKEIPMYVNNIAFFENYTIVEFTKEYYGGQVYTSLETRFLICSPRYKQMTYVIDNRTGKFYSLDSLLNKKDRYDTVDIYTYESLDCGDSFYFFENAGGHEEDTGIYRVCVENERLVVKQVFKGDPQTVFSSYMHFNMFDYIEDGLFADRYGNLCIKVKNQTYKDDYYLIHHNAETGADELSRLNDGWNFSLSINGEIYCVEQSKRIDENGEVVDAEFCNDLYFKRNQLIKHEEGVDYYYQVEKSTDSYKDAGVITKITWQDETKFSVEKFELEKFDSFYASTQDYLYFCGNQRIYRVKIADGTLDETYEPDTRYFFMSITPDNLGHVSFTALDRSQNTVVGKIDNEGNIDITVNPNEFKIYYIKPI